MKKKELLKLFVSKGLISLITLSTSITFNPSMAFAETGDIEWQKCLGGSGFDCAKSIQQTKDGGYIVAGSTASTDYDVSGNNGNDDYWIVKLDSDGNKIWQKCIGNNGNDCAKSI